MEEGVKDLIELEREHLQEDREEDSDDEDEK
jgi:hypothetical protein